MKVTFAVVGIVGLIGRCSELDLPIDHPWHGHLPPSAADDDAGVDEDTCGPPGLYADRWCKHLQRGVVPYAPSYELWADGADKQRHIYLPEGTQIDTSNADRWTFPVGTRLYKTFSLDGRRLETRVFEKTKEPADIESWTKAAYVWSDDQHTVEPVGADGLANVLGTAHDVPAADACNKCHDRKGFDIINGFGAIQLNHPGRGWTLKRLIEQERLVNASGEVPNVTLDNARIPGEPVDQAALGYLHANCGHCHGGPMPRAGLKLGVDVATTELAKTWAFQVATDCVRFTRWKAPPPPFVFVIDPGSAATSGVIGRMQARSPLGDPMHPLPPVYAKDQMPPVGTEIPDPTGIAHVSAWIDQLELHCDPNAPVPAPVPAPAPTPAP